MPRAPKSAAASRLVDAYIAAQPPPARAALKRVRSVIRRTLPAAEEVISYQIPTVKLSGVFVLSYAGWKKHYSLYPVSAALLAAIGGVSVPHEQSTGTIRFPFTEPVPAGLVARIVRQLARRAKARAQAKEVGR